MLGGTREELSLGATGTADSMNGVTLGSTTIGARSEEGLKCIAALPGDLDSE